MHKSGWMMGVAFVLVAACGGGAGSPGRAATTSADKTPSWMLGHWASGDGMVRLTLDRTGPKPKVKLDGSHDVIELTPEEVRPRFDLAGYVFVAPDGKRLLFVGTDGQLTFLRGRDELPMVRDADAAPLGAPTIVGTPPKPPPPEKTVAERERERLTTRAVRTRFPQFKSSDAASPAKIGEAIQLAKPDMFFYPVGTTAWFAPVPYGTSKGGLGFDQEPKAGPPTEEEKKSPLAQYNAWLRPDYEWGKSTSELVKSSWLHVYEHDFRKLEAKTPVLVWEVDGNDAILVTLDGGRYWESVTDRDEPTLASGVPPKAEWPSPLRNNLLHRESLVELGKLGLVDKRTAGDIDAAWSGWGECAKKVFAPAQKELEANLTGGTQFFAAQNKNALVLRRYDEKARRECKEFGLVESGLARVLAARAKERLAVYEKSKARLESLGLGR